MLQGWRSAVAEYWRWTADKFYYEGSTHYEYPGDFIPEEMYRVVYPNKITLLPASDY